MIEFICGRAGSGKSTYIAQKIRQALDAGRRRLILIVPEQQAVGRLVDAVAAAAKA